MKLFENNIKFNARSVALVGIMAATLECGKLALSFLPNIEVVTLLCALYGYVFGIYGVIATVIFVCIEPLIYGIGSWILTYIIYWPLVALVFLLLRKKGVNSRILLTLTALGLTVLFGVLSSLIDTAFYLGINENYLPNFCLYYVRGLVFYLVQLATNGVVFPTLFLFLAKKLEQIKSTLRL
ncbi:MAG: hypothetical protein IJX58_00140 [Clostridia bacterium]|nr:hypothetical protein [Clostridia bacterium]